MSALIETLLQLCRDRNIMLATAESCTGGLLAAALTELPGSSDVFDRGFVTYSYPSKTIMLDVSREILVMNGAVSPEVAELMAKSALSQSRAGLAISVTGVAGPGASEDKPEGMVWFGFAMHDKPVESKMKMFGPLGRAGVRAASVEFALTHAISLLKSTPLPEN